MNDYIQNLREKIGHQKIIHPAARIIIENENGQILFLVRKDNGKLGIPAGAFEENENIEECIRREVKEEVGLNILELKLVGISSSPNKELVEYPNGDIVQYFTLEFYSNKFDGRIIVDNSEVSSAEFLDFKFWEKLPINEQSTFISLNYYREKGSIRLN